MQRAPLEAPFPFPDHRGGLPPSGKHPLDNSRVNDYIVAMTGRVQKELKQRKPFQRVEDEAFVNIQRTADALLQGVVAALKPAGLSPTQYNVLRILRGAEPHGLACREIADRMITRDPDITRLLDRLEDRALVARSRDRADRRVITTRITAKGLHLLKDLDGPIAALHVAQLGHLGDEKLRSLIDLLEAARSKAR
jgi:DNA-binding MarR family transcriptional regulator